MNPMGHDKLRKFAENETFSCLLQPSSKELLADGTGVGRSTLLAPERAFTADSRIGNLAHEMLTLLQTL